MSELDKTQFEDAIQVRQRNQDAVQKLRRAADMMLSNSAEDWIKHVGRNRISVDPHSTIFERLLQLCREIKQATPLLSEGNSHDLNSAAEKLDQLYNLMNGAGELWDALNMNNFNVTCVEFERAILPILSWVVVSKALKTKEKLEDIEAAKAKANHAADGIVKLEATFNEIVSRSKIPASTLELRENQNLFGTQAGKHVWMARCWLSVATIVGLVIAVTVWLEIKRVDRAELERLSTIKQLSPTPPSQSATAPLPSFVSGPNWEHVYLRILLFSILFVALTFAIRNYNSQMHAAAVYRHRAKCLEAYRAYLALSPPDEKEVYSAFLRESMEAIFKPANTGYLREETDRSSNQVIEVFKSVKWDKS